MSSYFDGIQVGDRVYCYRAQTWAKVDAIFDEGPFRIKAIFYTAKNPHPLQVVFSHEGCVAIGEAQDVFWDEVKIDPPPRPKRKVKVTKWLNIYFRKDSTMEAFHHLSEQTAKNLFKGYDLTRVESYVKALPVEVEVDPPPRPKRNVEKKVWINLYKDDSQTRSGMAAAVHLSPESAADYYYHTESEYRIKGSVEIEVEVEE